MTKNGHFWGSRGGADCVPNWRIIKYHRACAHFVHLRPPPGPHAPDPAGSLEIDKITISAISANYHNSEIYDVTEIYNLYKL